MIQAVTFSSPTYLEVTNNLLISCHVNSSSPPERVTIAESPSTKSPVVNPGAAGPVAVTLLALASLLSSENRSGLMMVPPWSKNRGNQTVQTCQGQWSVDFLDLFLQQVEFFYDCARRDEFYVQKGRFVVYCYIVLKLFLLAFQPCGWSNLQYPFWTLFSKHLFTVNPDIHETLVRNKKSASWMVDAESLVDQVLVLYLILGLIAAAK